MFQQLLKTRRQIDSTWVSVLADKVSTQLTEMTSLPACSRGSSAVSWDDT